MAEGIDFEDDESFTHKLGILKESYFDGVTRPVNDTEEVSSNAEVLTEDSNDPINRYVNELNKQAKSREIYES